MLSEQITVTTTPTSIRELIADARSVDESLIQNKCTGIMLRYGKLETAIVSISDGVSGTKPASTAGAVILDRVNEDLLATSFSQFNIEKALISCNTGSVTVHVIVNQTL